MWKFTIKKWYQVKTFRWIYQYLNEAIKSPQVTCQREYNKLDLYKNTEESMEKKHLKHLFVF